MKTLHVFAVAFVCVAICVANFSVIQAASDDEDKAIADSLAAMLRAGRTVVSRNQDRINNPDIGDKGLDGKTVMEQALKIYQENTKTDPLLIDTSSRHGRLLRAQDGRHCRGHGFQSEDDQSARGWLQSIHSGHVRPSGQRSLWQTRGQRGRDEDHRAARPRAQPQGSAR